MSELTPQLSLVTSEEYKQWKSDTLATQNSHNVEIVQLQESERKKDAILNLDKRGEPSSFKVEVADGYRFCSSGPISATWSCPQWQELGCPAIFEAKLEKVPKTAPDDRLNSLASNISKQDQKCDSLNHCFGCKEYSSSRLKPDPLLFGFCSPEFVYGIRDWISSLFTKVHFKEDSQIHEV